MDGKPSFDIPPLKLWLHKPTNKFSNNYKKLGQLFDFFPVANMGMEKPDLTIEQYFHFFIDMGKYMLYVNN